MKFSVQGKSNKKQHFQITFGIPLWITKPFHAAAYQFQKFKFWLNPYHCNVCGKRQYVLRPQYEHIFDNGRRLMVENTASDNKDGKYKSYCVCRECLVKELEAGVWKPRFSHMHEQREGKPSRYNYRFWSQKTCDITNKKVRSYKDVEIFPYVDMLFCTNAWNSSRVSKEAVVECVKHGQIRSSVWGIYKGKMMQMNLKRLYINDKGELL